MSQTVIGGMQMGKEVIVKEVVSDAYAPEMGANCFDIFAYSEDALDTTKGMWKDGCSCCIMRQL